MTDPTYFLRWTDASGQPHATTEPMPRGQLKSTVLSLRRQGCTGLRVWQEMDMFVAAAVADDTSAVVIGDWLQESPENA
jgi:hypothetical protein